MENFIFYAVYYHHLQKKNGSITWFSPWGGEVCMFIEDLVTSIYKTFYEILIKSCIWSSLSFLKFVVHIPQW